MKHLTKKQINSLLKEADKRGFRSGRYFISASGISDCLILGTLMVKYTKDETDENAVFNGDIVSTGGYGLIYDASTDTWGVPVENALVGTSLTKVNARKVKQGLTSIDDYDY